MYDNFLIQLEQSEHKQWVDLIRIFAYGRWADYKGMFILHAHFCIYTYSYTICTSTSCVCIYMFVFFHYIMFVFVCFIYMYMSS